MYCKECGQQIADDSKFCASCGKPQSNKVTSFPEKKQEVDNSGKLENALKNARMAMKNKSYGQAEKFYNIALEEEPENWEATFYIIYSQARLTNSLNFSETAYSIANCIKTVLKNIKKIDDATRQNEAIKQISADLCDFLSYAYFVEMYKYNRGKEASNIFNDDGVLTDAKLEDLLKYTNDVRNNFLPFVTMLTSFGNELVSEYGKNEFTTFINIQCYEAILKTLRELYDSTTDAKFDESSFNSILQKYADELSKIKPSESNIKTSSVSPSSSNLFLDSFHTPEKKDGFLTKPLAPDGCGCGCLPAFATAPIFIIGAIVFGIIIAIITPESNSTSAPNTGDQKIKARVQLELSIKANLREPKSYQNIATDVWTLDEYIYVKNTFRAKNNFGGYEVCTFVAHFNFNTKPAKWDITNKPSSDIGCRAIMIALP
ncbi:MAG: zinc ribbon domain-containing protein [Fibromonadales bacterium]|nr:zinc ribbon domain-containing protein [Fibromonadales bacterium]